MGTVTDMSKFKNQKLADRLVRQAPQDELKIIFSLVEYDEEGYDKYGVVFSVQDDQGLSIYEFTPDQARYLANEFLAFADRADGEGG